MSKIIKIVLIAVLLVTPIFSHNYNGVVVRYNLLQNIYGDICENQFTIGYSVTHDLFRR